MKTYTPLHNFHTFENEFAFSDYITLKALHILDFEIRDDGSLISNIEHRDSLSCGHWLVVNEEKSKLDKGVVINTFLLSIWMLAANKVSCKLSFEDSETGGITNLLTRFQYNDKNKNKNYFDVDDLQKIRKYYEMLESITKTNYRLLTALSSTFQGCIAFHWQTAYLLYSTAIEAMLTYEKGYGITDRLAKAYACLVETDNNKRIVKFKQFKKLYNVRSDIIHGKVIANKAEENLLTLAELESVLRKLWQVVLSDARTIDSLEKIDSERKIYFNNLEKDFLQ